MKTPELGSMNIDRLQALIRETRNDKSPLWEMVYWYGINAAFTSAGALAMLRVMPGMIQIATGRPASSSVLNPPVWVLCLVLVVGGLIGAACGLCVGRFVNSAASDHPRLAFPLLFVVLFVPQACILAAWTMALIAASQGVDQPVAWLGALVAGCAINCYRWRRKGWPGAMPNNDQQSSQ